LGKLTEKRKKSATTNKSSGSLDDHLEQETKTPGTTIATDPTVPLSPSESTTSSAKRDRTTQLLKTSHLGDKQDVAPIPSPLPPPPPSETPPKSLVSELREDFEVAKSPANTRSSYRKRALRNSDGCKALQNTLQMTSTTTTPKEKSSRKLRLDAKLGKKESKLRQRSNGHLQKEIPKELQDEPKKVKKTTRRKLVEHVAEAEEKKKKASLKRTKSDNDKHAPHNRPGVAHHKSPSATIAVIVDKIPTMVSCHSKKSKDPSTDDSIASFNSTLTPSVGSQEANEQAMDDDWEPDVFEDALDGEGEEDDTAADPSKVTNRFMEKSAKEALDSPMKAPISAWQLREEARQSDFSPTVPMRRLSSVRQIEDDSPSVPKRFTPVLRIEEDGDESISLAESANTEPVTCRWTSKDSSDLPPAFAAVDNYYNSSRGSAESQSSLPSRGESTTHSRSTTTSRSIRSTEQSLFSRGSAESQCSLPFIGESTTHSRSSTHSRSIRSTVSSTIRKYVSQDEGSKVKKGTASEVLKNKISQMNELRNSTHIPASAVKAFSAGRINSGAADEETMEPHTGESKRKIKKSQSSRSLIASRTSSRSVSPSTRRRLRKEKDGDEASLGKSAKPKSTKQLAKKSKNEQGRSSQGSGELEPKTLSKKLKNNLDDAIDRKLSKAKSSKNLKKAKGELDGSSHSSASRSTSSRSRSKSVSTKSNELDGANDSRSTNSRSRSKSVSSRSKSPMDRRSSESSSSKRRSKSPRDRSSSRSKSPKGGKRQPKSLVQPERLAPWQIKQQLKHRITPVGSLYDRRLDDDDDMEDPSLPSAFRSPKSKKTKKSVGRAAATDNLRGSTKEERKKVKADAEKRRSSSFDATSGRFGDEGDDGLPPPAFRHLTTTKEK
jgi:hypothetical protein